MFQKPKIKDGVPEGGFYNIDNSKSSNYLNEKGNSILFNLELLGGLKCAKYTLGEKGSWPDDLCCEDSKDDQQKIKMAELEAILPRERTEDQKKEVNLLRDILPTCVDDKGIKNKGICNQGKIGSDACLGMCSPEVNQEIFEEYKICKYYQAPGSMAAAIGGFTFTAMASGLFSAMYSLKAATKPSPSDFWLTKVFGAFGFLGFVLGCMAIAMFTPGTRGDTAAIKGGFFVQVIGLCGLLAGVICIMDAGDPDVVMPAITFGAFAAGEKSNKVSPAVV